MNEKSDVYSYGVVLLQIITNRPAFISSSSNDKTHISNWVTAIVNNGDIESIVDPRLAGDFNINSVWKAVEIALACLSPSGDNRPNMNEVVSELNDCLGVEQARRTVGVSNTEAISMYLETDSNPVAR